MKNRSLSLCLNTFPTIVLNHSSTSEDLGGGGLCKVEICQGSSYNIKVVPFAIPVKFCSD